MKAQRTSEGGEREILAVIENMDGDRWEVTPEGNVFRTHFAGRRIPRKDGWRSPILQHDLEGHLRGLNGMGGVTVTFTQQ